jgi:hypothetical protein
MSHARGNLVDWSTQRWVQATGRRVSLAEHPWLDGPIGRPTGIGTSVFEDYASRNDLTLLGNRPCGLLADFDELRGPDFDPAAVAPGVADFYECASEYEIDTWSQWTGAFRPFGRALAAIFSRRLQQLNVPLSGLDTSRGMTSGVKAVVRRATGERLYATWVRSLARSGDVIYAGAYSTCEVPNYAGRCVRVVFPLPNGSATVIMRPSAGADGSLTLRSEGRRFGDPGFYFTVHGPNGVVWARYLRTMRETIHVYAAGPGEVRADHTMTVWRMTFLRLHYRLRRRS